MNVRRRGRRWEQLDVNTNPERVEVLCTTTGELGELYGVDSRGRAHVRFHGDRPGVVDDTIDPATLMVEAP